MTRGSGWAAVNERRAALIDRDLGAGLGPAEAAELARLDRLVDAVLDAAGRGPDG